MSSVPSTPMAVASAADDPSASLYQFCSQRLQLARAKTLELLAEPAHHVPPLTAIVRYNLLTGRAARVGGPALVEAATAAGLDRLLEPTRAGSEAAAALRAYVDRVIQVYLLERARVAALARHEHAAWQALGAKLQRVASSLLQGWGLSPARAWVEAEEFAQDACEVIHQKRFPFDVPFDAWATLILSNNIRRRFTRSQELSDRHGARLLSLEAAQDPADPEHRFLLNLRRAPLAATLEDRERQELLLGAIAALPSEAQQQVILLSYLSELSDETIATRLGKSKNAVYVLRHRALARLRVILGL